MSSEQEAPPFTMVRDAYVTAWDSVVDVADIPEVHAQARVEFDRFISKVKADALREAAEDMDNTDDPDAIHIANGDADLWLKARADRIEGEA